MANIRFVLTVLLPTCVEVIHGVPNPLKREQYIESSCGLDRVSSLPYNISVTAESMVLCAAECTQNDDCTGANYYTTNTSCHLFFYDLINLCDDVISSPGAWYIRKEQVRDE